MGVALGGWLTLAACEGPTDEARAPELERADAAPRDGASLDVEGDAGDGNLAATRLEEGSVVLLGATTGPEPMAIYIAKSGDASRLKAVKLGGGEAVIIAPQLAKSDSVAVSGGAVGYWTDVKAGIGTFNVWTPAHGSRSLPGSASLATAALFAASDDGERVAFSVKTNASTTTTSLAVTDTAAPSATPVLTGNTSATSNAVNIAELNNCAPQLGFVGARFFAGYCTGVSTTATTARLFTVATGATAAQRLDAKTNGAANALRIGSAGVLWKSDRAGTRLFVRSATGAGRLLSTSSPGVGVDLDKKTSDGAIAADGMSVVYLTEAKLVHATTASPPVKTNLVATGTAVRGIVGLSADGARVSFRTKDPSDDRPPRADLYGVGTTAANQMPVAYVTTASASPIGFTGSGDRVVYLTDVDEAKGGALNARPAAGGDAVTLATGVFGGAIIEGDRIVAFVDPHADEDFIAYDLAVVDVAHPAPPAKIASMVRGGAFFAAGGTVVWASNDPASPGLYARSLP